MKAINLLSEQEKCLLDTFRALAEVDQAIVIKTAAGLKLFSTRRLDGLPEDQDRSS